MTEGSERAPHGADSEVGRLRTVMLHRPGPELKRLTPRNNDKLLFDGIPWVGRAQDEHDAFAQALRDHDVEVLYLADLLAEALEVERGPSVVVADVHVDQAGTGRLAGEGRLDQLVQGHRERRNVRFGRFCARRGNRDQRPGRAHGRIVP